MPIVQGKHYIYTVRPGDTLYSIAARLGSNVQLIGQTNALYPPITDPGLIYPGQVLIVSEAGISQQQNAVLYIIGPGDTLTQIASRFSVSVDLMAGINQIPDPNLIYINQMITAPAFIYEVAQGDTLFRIGQFFGVTLGALLQANQRRPGLSPDVIYPGYRLIIPLPSTRNVVIFNPLPGTRIEPGQSLEGYARVFEATAQYQIRDNNGQIVTKERTITTSEGAPAYGRFSAVIQFDAEPTTSEGQLWVYSYSAKDGSIQDLTAVKVMFR
ncbi:MAG TPA: LysM peptidoglycan-binding domain-containing protein [Bacilli bacterium]